jgi:alpha-glucosidase
MPVYVRAGSILPRQPLVQSTDETPVGPLELRVYLPEFDDNRALPQAAVYQARCEGSLYTDDGNSFAFRKGEYFRSSLHCARTSLETSVTMSAAEGHYVPWWKEIDVMVIGVDSAPAKVLLNGKPMAAAASTFDAAKNVVHVRVPASAAGWTLTLAK